MNLKDKICLIERKIVVDHRGWFLKAITGKEENIPCDTAEVYVTLGKPNEKRGGHYHPIAKEWFILLTGQCVVKLFDTVTKEFLEITLDSKKPQTLYVPNLVAHIFINRSEDQDFMLLAYSDRLFDPSDTINYDFSEIKSDAL